MWMKWCLSPSLVLKDISGHGNVHPGCFPVGHQLRLSSFILHSLNPITQIFGGKGVPEEHPLELCATIDTQEEWGQFSRPLSIVPPALLPQITNGCDQTPLGRSQWCEHHGGS